MLVIIVCIPHKINIHKINLYIRILQKLLWFPGMRGLVAQVPIFFSDTSCVKLRLLTVEKKADLYFLRIYSKHFSFCVWDVRFHGHLKHVKMQLINTVFNWHSWMNTRLICHLRIIRAHYLDLRRAVAFTAGMQYRNLSQYLYSLVSVLFACCNFTTMLFL